MSEEQELKDSVYAVSIEVDGRQKYLFESDKLREMLGASLIMDQTRVLSQDPIPKGNSESDLWFSDDVKVFQPASGDIKAWSEDKAALLEGCVKAKKWLSEKGLQHTISWLTMPKAIFEEEAESTDTQANTHQTSNTSDSTSDKKSPPKTLSEGHRHLSNRSRQRKDAKSYPDARPQWSLFAQCLIHGQEPAENWYPHAADDPERKDGRRGLTGSRAETKFKQWESSKKGAFYQTNLKKPLIDRMKNLNITIDHQRSITFSDLTDQNQAEDQYLAFVCADGDGMGNLLESLNWNQKFKEPQNNDTYKTIKEAWNCLKPWQRNKVFSLGYDACVRQAFHQALAEVILPDKDTANEIKRRIENEKSIFVPVLPQLIGGDDLWMVVSRKYALDLCRVFAQKYKELIQAEPMIEAARLQSSKAHLTISMGVAFTKASFPAHYMIQLAEELLKSAKSLRKKHLYGRSEDADIEGCLDWHWIESSRMEAVSAARQQAWSYKVGEDALYLTSRPWTAAQSKAFIQAAKAFQKIPRRKREQLETILRLGYRPSLLAWESWYTGLSQAQKGILKEINDKHLPENWKQETDNHPRIGFNPWRKLGENVYATPWLDLLQLQHVLGIEGQYQGTDADQAEEPETAQLEANHV